MCVSTWHLLAPVEARVPQGGSRCSSGIEGVPERRISNGRRACKPLSLPPAPTFHDSTHIEPRCGAELKIFILLGSSCALRAGGCHRALVLRLHRLEPTAGIGDGRQCGRAAVGTEYKSLHILSHSLLVRCLLPYSIVPRDFAASCRRRCRTCRPCSSVRDDPFSRQRSPSS